MISSYVRLWQEVVLKFRYNLLMNNIKHVKILLVERDEIQHSPWRILSTSKFLSLNGFS